MNEEKLKAIKYLYDSGYCSNEVSQCRILNYIGQIVYDKITDFSESNLKKIVDSALNW
jgi:hypothetical protein